MGIRSASNIKIGGWLAGKIKDATNNKIIDMHLSNLAVVRDGASPDKHTRKAAIILSLAMAYHDEDFDPISTYENIIAGKLDFLESLGWNFSSKLVPAGWPTVIEITARAAESMRKVSEDGIIPTRLQELYPLWLYADDLAFHETEAGKIGGGMAKGLSEKAELNTAVAEKLRTALGTAAIDNFRGLHPYQEESS